MLHSIVYLITGLLLFTFTAINPGSLDTDKETGTISGTVVEAETGDPITDATVSVVGGDATTQTDQDGHFELTELSQGSHTLLIEADGFPSKEHYVNLDSDHEKVEIELEADM